MRNPLSTSTRNFLALSVLFIALCGSAATLGDLNADAKVDVVDLVRLLQHMRGTNALPQNVQPLADFDGDGLVTQSDADALANTILELYPLREVPPATILSTSPTTGEGNVALTRETVIRFTQPLASSSVVGVNTLYAEFGGRKILSRVEMGSDRRSLTLFYLEPLPSSARVRVTLRGDDITAAVGTFLDADGDGSPGGIGQFDFDTASITPIAGTAVIGTVYASELAPDAGNVTNSINVPLAGVTVEVVGAENTLRTITDSNGFFRLMPSPAGRFFVHVSGHTVTNLAAGIRYPDKSYYPNVGKAWEAVPGRTNNLAGGNGLIYLPLIRQGTLQPISSTTNTIVTFPASVIASNPALAGVVLDIPRGTLYSDNGTRGGSVGIALVAPDRLPEPLPPQLNFSLVFTVQTDGPSNFSEPIAVQFPNLPNPVTGSSLAPGEKMGLWSFNHDLGRWVINGTMTVTDDGAFLRTDPGVGILQPGWHGILRILLGPPNPCLGPCCVRDSNGNLTETGKCIRDRGRYLGICLAAGYVAAFTKCITPNPRVCLYSLASWLIGCTTASGISAVDCIEDCKSGAKSTSPAIEVHPVNKSDSVIDAVLDRYRAINELIYTNSYTGQPLNSAQTNALTILQDQILQLTDGNPEAVIQDYLRSHEVVIEPDENRVGNAPAYPIRFVATYARPGAENLVIRGWTESFGQYAIPEPDGASLQFVGFFDPRTGDVGASLPKLNRAARFRMLPTILRANGPISDFDGDGLTDFIEFIVGTDPRMSDTDGDGVSDRAEMQQGSNPLDGIPTLAGILSSAPISGIANDVVAFNDVALVGASGAERQLTLYDVRNSLSPTRMAEVTLPGNIAAVALTDLHAIIASTAGLHIVSANSNAAARLLRGLSASEIGGAGRAVAAVADLAFVGSEGGLVSMIDLNLGIVLQQLNLGAAIQDVAIEGMTLYAYAGGKLHIIPFDSGLMQKVSEIVSPEPAGINTANGRGRLFVGGGIAYPVHKKGYNTISVSNPAAPVLLSVGNTTQFGWKQIVLNGSGIGVAAMSPNQAFDGPHDIALYDTRDPRTNDLFLTQIETPGVARAVSLYNGLAYVADHASGFHVINYLPFDTGTNPPSGSLRMSVTNGEASGGGLVLLQASVQDDVQVRNVEFFANGQRIVLDGNFPFETIYRVPTNMLGQQVAFSITVSDTGGNRSSTTNTPVQIVPDNQPPAVAITSPTISDTFFDGDVVPLQVAATDNTGIESIRFELNDVPWPARRLSYGGWQFDGPIPTGTNFVVAIARDFAGLETRSAAAPIRVRKQTISRELTVFNLGPSEIQGQAVSREMTVFNIGPAESGGQALSREMTIFNVGPSESSSQSISREVTVFNFGPEEKPQTVSREISVERK